MVREIGKAGISRAGAHPPEGPKAARKLLKEGSEGIKTFMKEAGDGLLGAGKHTYSPRAPAPAKLVNKVAKELLM